MCHTINYSELCELHGTSTRAIWFLIFLCTFGSPFQGAGTGFLGLWQPQGGDVWLVGGQLRKVLAFASSATSDLSSAKDEIPGKRELGPSQVQLLLSPWVGEEILGSWN